ncbi:hypothetical protein PoB_007021600 [Plakobranchus ocellatus]|uniref:CCHC-type domain-containing protein n=1 Tax=Plakobranchus ocellatus TaxID=259542 RepID=A0AAV4DIM6_9GAST|nr:hypothetical protein PoB_007021600 [Plakobranchus ocellatus]
MSELDLHARYLDMGAKLGRSGDDLAVWAEDKVRQDMEHNDRQIEREKQREERESQRQLECKKLEMETQFYKIGLESKHNVDTATPRQGYGTQKPKLPLLSDPSQLSLSLIVLRYVPMIRAIVGIIGLGHRSPSSQDYSGSGRSDTSHTPSRNRNRPSFNTRNVGRGQQFGPNSSGSSGVAASRNDVTCYRCGGKGHVRRECPSRPKEANSACSVPKLPSHYCAAESGCDRRGKLKIESC